MLERCKRKFNNAMDLVPPSKRQRSRCDFSGRVAGVLHDLAPKVQLKAVLLTEIVCLLSEEIDKGLLRFIPRRHNECLPCAKYKKHSDAEKFQSMHNYVKHLGCVHFYVLTP